jgi:3-deoxy-manno-octulosonate cytidylyltransferase (CMP-KDO synthetase)
VSKDDDVCILVPARLNSSRLQNKVLLPFDGVPMVIKVANNCLEVSNENVFVLTPDLEIMNICKDFGIKSELTSFDCVSGTDRVVEFSKKHKYSKFISVQADEPFLEEGLIREFILKFDGNNCVGISRIYDPIEIESESVVKIVKSISSSLMYASRSVIPNSKNIDSENCQIYYKHVGIYGFNQRGLHILANTDRNSLEKSENIEILRFLENDIEVNCIEVDYNGYAIDTIDDYNRYLTKGI